MNDDPSLRDVLKAAAKMPKKVAISALDAKIPVGAARSVGRFLMGHWLSGVLAVVVLVWITGHYASQMNETRYMCYGPRANFTLPREPEANIVIRAALALSPVAQLISSWSLRNGKEPYEASFGYKDFLQKNELDISYGPLVAGADNEEHAIALVRYEKGQTISRCIANNSGLTLIVVFMHALVAYLLFIIIPLRR